MITNKSKIVVFVLSMIALMTNTASATVDFSGLTDLINATMTILSTFVNNSSTLINFIVLMAELGLISIIVYGFVAVFLVKMGKKIGGGGK